MHSRPARKNLDETLKSQGVRFFPWIGKLYDKGFKGKRLLILGESCYYKPSEVSKPGAQFTPAQFTRYCVEKYGKGRDPRNTRLWRNLEQACLDSPSDETSCKRFWDSVAFYNFIQVRLPGQRCRPPQNQFKKAWDPFRAVINALRPERVLVCGKGLWNGMDDCERSANGGDNAVQAYRLSGGQHAWCLATFHPCCGGRYKPKKLHPVIKQFIRRPDKMRRTL